MLQPTQEKLNELKKISLPKKLRQRRMKYPGKIFRRMRITAV